MKAIIALADHFGEKDNAVCWLSRYEKGGAYTETELYNGEYFEQRVQWRSSREDVSGGQACGGEGLLTVEGPKYQYGMGCLSDGVLGAWMAKLTGLGDILDPEKITSYLLSVYKYNLKYTMEGYFNL